jgi:hypothetical protein
VLADEAGSLQDVVGLAAVVTGVLAHGDKGAHDDAGLEGVGWRLAEGLALLAWASTWTPGHGFPHKYIKRTCVHEGELGSWT